MNTQTRLFVGNLPDNTDNNELKFAFSTFGEVTNLDIKTKSTEENSNKKFAFVTLSASFHNVESCIKYFTNELFKGNKLYVTRARESFLERLERERLEAQNKEFEKKHTSSVSKNNPVINLSDKLNPRKRKLDYDEAANNTDKHNKINIKNKAVVPMPAPGDLLTNGSSLLNKKKEDSDKKRMESIRKKRQEFKEKQMIIKTGLIGIDSMQNKKKVFSDSEDNQCVAGDDPENKKQPVQEKKQSLFDDDDSGDEVNFEIKKHFEGKKGQKVLDLQSRYKSDKRFVLDERFIEDNENEDENENVEKGDEENENIDVGQMDEKTKQLNILQDVLGVSIKSNFSDPVSTKSKKSKLGMLRFDPLQPDHEKFLAPVETKEIISKKSKKKHKEKQDAEIIEPSTHVSEAPEVSKEQFYKVSESLKETIAQPTAFSLRSLFVKEDPKNDGSTQEVDYIPLDKPKEPKKRNPLDPGEKNPFVYDSSESENEENDANQEKHETDKTKIKHIWKENLFFSDSDSRLEEGLAFFVNINGMEAPKERRELKSLMKKRIYNKERKKQMFQKKIGGKKKSFKKNYKRRH